MGHRRWIALLASLFVIAAAQFDPSVPGQARPPFPEEDGGQGPSTAVTTRAAVETQRVPVESPPRLRGADIEALLASLESDLFKVRHEARTKLESLVFLPDVAKAMEVRLQATTDPEVRESLKPLLARREEMLVMVGGNSVHASIGPGQPVRFIPGHPGDHHPWLVVSGDGSFVYEAASVLFTRKVPMPAESDVRMGRLTGEQLWTVAEKVRRFPARELPDKPTTAPAQGAGSIANASPPSGTHVIVNVMLYLRLPQRAFLWDGRTWTMEQFLHPEGSAADVRLAADVCALVASCPSRPYNGPMGLCLAAAPPTADASKLPEWPADAVGFSFSDVSKYVVYPLSPDQLRAAREALKANPVYRSGPTALRPYLAPYIRQAMAVRLGHLPEEGP